MSRLSKKLTDLLSNRLGYECEVWFDRSSGWLFKTNNTYPQRLGYTYKQAQEFILHFDWDSIMNNNPDLGDISIPFYESRDSQQYCECGGILVYGNECYFCEWCGRWENDFLP